MTRAGEPLQFEVDIGEATTGEPRGARDRVTLMRALGGLVVVTLDREGRPERSAAGVRKLRGNDS
jgi:hypothetical protein